MNEIILVRVLNLMSESLYTLFVHPVTQVSEETLRRTFVQYGDVEDVYIPRDFKTKKRRDFAYIKFSSKYCASRAIEQLDNTELNGKVISVSWSKEKSKTPDEMQAIRDQRKKEKEEREGAKPMKYTPEEYQKIQEEKAKGKPFHEKYFTVVNYPPGVGLDYTPEYQKGLKPVGERKTFYSWVYVPEEKIREILMKDKQHEYDKQKWQKIAEEQKNAAKRDVA